MAEIRSTVQDVLIKNDIRPSYTRLKIFDFLYRDKIHPNVDTIYKELIEEIPTLSKTTVYNTLKLLMDKGLVRAVNVYENEMRYEAIRDEHGHFKCNACEEIYDVPINIDVKLPKEMEGTTIDEQHLIITGLCYHCNEK